ncbi:NUDIX domain-containing protein [Natronobiforma cellulositropha]|uniref:NUDIX domain-containing protein n=1 Tax=Natronobiforma cellulositropha TaxID=1679076 RepID=UPI0021D60A5C|nr:NUDIX domain-containing protein [Natronobiforma cellulositropha]
MEDSETVPVVTAFLRHRGEILLLERSDAVGSYAGFWGGVSGYAEGGPDEQVRREIREETGLEEAVSLVRAGRPVRVEDEDLERTWRVHPYLFECAYRDVELSEEHVDAEWVSPTAILAERETVPMLWTCYERVAPTVRSISADGDHGAAYLSIRALEVLRDRAALLVAEREGAGEVDGAEEWDELLALARRVREARPSMAVLRNRVTRALGEAADRDAESALESTVAAIERAYAADEGAARVASEYASGRVLTLSQSETVRAALERGGPNRVFVAESRPAGEGVETAEALAEETAVTLLTDAAVAHVLARGDVDCVLVGADTLVPDGRVVNKAGTRAAALAASNEGVPVYVASASEKVATSAEVALESGPATAVYDGEARLDAINPTFDVTPADCVTGYLTEDGRRSSGDIGEVAAEASALEKEVWGEAVE